MNLVVRRGGTFTAATVASGRLLCLLDEAENVTRGMVVGQDRRDWSEICYTESERNERGPLHPGIISVFVIVIASNAWIDFK